MTSQDCFGHCKIVIVFVYQVGTLINKTMVLHYTVICHGITVIPNKLRSILKIDGFALLV